MDLCQQFLTGVQQLICEHYALRVVPSWNRLWRKMMENCKGRRKSEG